ncbi:outer membrane protein [Aestuariivirga sp.]|uniref:outer membrane protein n=1 Tax=Aestuariivirga sp. TaxID=2650926 RepID=UPI0039E3C3DC
MSKLLAGILLSSLAIAALNAPLRAADVAPSDPGHGYIQLNGTYAFGDVGSGIESTNIITPGDFKTGDGVWASAYFGYVTPYGWDWRVGVGGADLSQGKLRGTGNNRFGVDDAKMLNFDADIGYQMGSGDINFRPSLGIRYLGWDQDQGYHPDSPLGCCGLSSGFDGFGPKLGFDAAVPMSGGVSLVGGAEASVLFGNIDHDAGTSYSDPKGSKNRTAYTYGGYAGIDWAINNQLTIGARYNLMVLDGTSFRKANLFTSPSGRGENVLHGPSINVMFAF